MDANGEEENVLMFKDVHLCQLWVCWWSDIRLCRLQTLFSFWAITSQREKKERKVQKNKQFVWIWKSMI